MGLVSTVVNVTNTAPSAYTLTITNNQDTSQKAVTIAGGGVENVNWGVPWYTDKNYPWPGRSLYFEFSDVSGALCGASVWQHGVGVLWEQGNNNPANPSTGTSLAQEGASFNVTATLNIPTDAGGTYTMTLA